ncbi:cAMP-binding domain of CRP or a regulatory subunit of cAMP-dependent protein kinases [Sporobacter termitidis DSM 10068]|uniref:cAMP-binding domain of CRP or a regulatory subunit of cAMP-dependent protein kinases n=1 Tax=Sporobacter termitidis DSM 10068 TaxID=1123282 RepID=A0A1M5ZI90_9FIRM|nr:cyclic nucleotide-binding domain-containing protein [Sporobacter termitidis]SHI23932.1 cAMP-binding domain of CRP or a regulatory subunit of cAMP-dependent protein kinases [Sporobacter termitidis DSM 10068]
MEKRRAHEAELNLLSQYGLRSDEYKDAVCLSFEPGEYVVREGGAIGGLFFVVSGKAKICLSVSSGRQLLLCYFVSSGIIGDVELMTGRREAFSTVQAATKLTCIVLPLSDYAAALKENIVFVNRIGKGLAEKLMQRGTNGAVTILQPLENRLCAYILQTSDGGVFRENLTEVAQLVGASYRHLLRCLDKLRREGILRKTPSGYQITDPRALRDRAGDLYVT